MRRIVYLALLLGLDSACLRKNKILPSTPSSAVTCDAFDQACLVKQKSPQSCDIAYTAEQANLRSLTNEEIGNVLADVFQIVDDAKIRNLPRRDQGTKFQNAVLELPLSESFLSQWQNVALDIALDIGRNPELGFRLQASCPSGINPTCLASFAGDLATVLWRRPPDAESLNRLTALLSGDPEIPLSNEERITRLVAALFLDPRFLYKMEYLRAPEAAPQPLDSYEIASRLAFFIWRSTPDAALLARAAKGEIEQQEAFLEETERMLADPRSERGFNQFLNEWLLLDNVANLQLSGQMPNYGQFRESIFKQSKDFLFDYPGSIEKALGGGTSVQQSLLLQPAVLGGLSVSSTTSPVKRGLFINDRILCRKIPPPPVNAGVFQAEALALDVTPRERFKVHEENPSCASCHEAIDGIGLSLESFDALGQKRDLYENGKPIDTTGSIRLNGTRQNYRTGEEMIAAIGQSQDAKGCFTVTVAEYAWGVSPSEKNSCELSKIYASMAGKPHTWKNLVRSIVQHPSFRVRPGSQP